MRDWLSVEAFASLAMLPLRTARHAAAKAAAGKPVKRWPIVVRQSCGAGGRSGVRYEVALKSLQETLQREFRDRHANAIVTNACNGDDRRCIGSTKRIVGAANQSAEIARRWGIIEDAVSLPYGSAGRAAEADRASAKHRVPLRTIQRWIKRFEDAGGDMSLLGRSRPADAGKPRVVVTRVFDKAFLAAGHDRAQLGEIGEVATTLIASIWATPVQRAGKTAIIVEVATSLARACADRGIILPRKAYNLSTYRIYQLAHFRQLDQQKNDRKSWNDTTSFIRRDNSQLGPMDEIVMDVKPLDNIVVRPDCTTTWPKMIAFQDTGTHRVFAYFVLLPKGEGVRQEHVTEAFLAMVSDPAWGFPRSIYRDNGTEFAVFDRIRSAMEMLNEPGARTIVNAKAYAGSSKPIESKFATLDRFVFSQMGGWAGGNRMNKKTQTLGKPPKPYAEGEGSQHSASACHDRRPQA